MMTGAAQPANQTRGGGGVDPQAGQSVRGRGRGGRGGRGGGGRGGGGRGGGGRGDGAPGGGGPHVDVVGRFPGDWKDLVSAAGDQICVGFQLGRCRT